MFTSGQPTHEPSIYLRPKRNSRIYFTYALLPPYFQLYCGRSSRRRSQQGCARASAFWLHKKLRELTDQVSHTRSRRTTFGECFIEKYIDALLFIYGQKRKRIVRSNGVSVHNRVYILARCLHDRVYKANITNVRDETLLIRDVLIIDPERQQGMM